MGTRIAVCDDEEVVYHRILSLLEGTADRYLIDYYPSGESILRSEKVYDIVFLDIEMGLINGLKVAKQLRKQGRNEYIIFLTSHTEFMVEAFKVRAFRFLCKPIDRKAFFEAITEAENEMLGKEKVIISSYGNKYVVAQEDIAYIESLGDGTCVHTENGEYINSKTLKYWEGVLDSTLFYKSHKTYLVNFGYVQVVNQNDALLSVNGNEVIIPISRRQKTEFKQLYMEFARAHAISY